MSYANLREKLNFAPPTYEPDAILFIATAAQWEGVELKVGILELKFGVEFDVSDAVIKTVVTAPVEFRHKLRAISAGNPDRNSDSRISVTDDALSLLAPACPNLQHVTFYSAPGLSGNTLSSIPYGLLYLPNIKSITMTGKQNDFFFLSGLVLMSLMKQPCKTLRYLELGDCWTEPEITPHVVTMTRIMPQLEILFGFGGIWELLRQGNLVAKEGVIDQGKRFKNGIWEEEY